MRYEAVQEISRKEYDELIATNDPQKIAGALLGISYWNRDWKWTQDELLKFIDHKDYWVRRTAAQGFGYVARVNGKLETDRIEPILRKMAKKPPSNVSESQEDMYLRGTAEDALEDIEIFIHRKAGESRLEARS